MNLPSPAELSVPTNDEWSRDVSISESLTKITVSQEK